MPFFKKNYFLETNILSNIFKHPNQHIKSNLYLMIEMVVYTELKKSTHLLLESNQEVSLVP